MPQLQKETKRYKVDKDKTTVFVLIAIASVVIVATLLIGKGLWGQASYLNKVASKKEMARDQLEENKSAVNELTTSYKALVAQNPNLLGGNSEGTGEREGDNASLILDALPNKYDFPALAASLEKILTGYVINGITGIDDSIAQQTVQATGPAELPFAIDVTANYDGFKQLIGTFNHSIRPFQITKLDITGTNAALNILAQGKTYYQPELGLQIKEEEVQ
jgi:hypothetical protein